MCTLAITYHLRTISSIKYFFQSLVAFPPLNVYTRYNLPANLLVTVVGSTWFTVNKKQGHTPWQNEKTYMA